MKAIALLGGPENKWPADLKQQLLLARKKQVLLIGVDRGSILLEELGFVPDLAVGDFDSLKPKELAQIEANVSDIRYSAAAKDFTDTELMIRYAFEDYQVDSLTMYGATGGRIDHFLNNFLMCLHPQMRPFAEKMVLIDEQNAISFYNPGQHQVQRLAGYSYFGVATLTAVTDLNIKHARYDLEHYCRDYPVSFSSNEFLPASDDFELSFAKGVVAVIQAKDLDRFQNI
ncbi:thiamine diphosphokinase [Lactobacillus sp. ESL0684]|uniref:thiamine diphosphokinase n=1 Tax=Lactobacillus sp. ESL0684 TaxID=2983213 RepID=UPI0023F655AA|nr:thiamine diphosphokinase [Lactobacillus sp. ESL0684]WEV44323.1 thiamine diphosphokinase [Lactobacillus sp. ESL0684]